MELQDILETTTYARVAGGFQFTEGPVWHPEGYLLFSDIPASIIYRYEPDSGEAPVPWRQPSGNSNGLTYDRAGRLLACEHGNRRVSRTEPDGTITPLATHYQGARLNSPNDIVVRSDGSIYFTDPPYGITEDQRELPYNGLYRISPDGELSLLETDFGRPNGLVFSPDESLLYVDDSPRREIRVFGVNAAGELTSDRLFANLESLEEGSPDGMKVDVMGNLYCAGPGGIWIFEPSGALVGIVAGPERPANLAFGDADLCTLYITARTGLYTLRTRNPGLAVF